MRVTVAATVMLLTWARLIAQGLVMAATATFPVAPKGIPNQVTPLVGVPGGQPPPRGPVLLPLRDEPSEEGLPVYFFRITFLTLGHKTIALIFLSTP